MKKLLFVLLCSVSAFLGASDSHQFVYSEFSTLGGYPLVGPGFRLKKGVNSFDLSGQIMVINPSIFHLKGSYLFYPQQEGFYLGAGVGMINEPESLRHLSGAFEGALGYEWKVGKNHPLFVECNVITPFQEPQGTIRAWPGVSFGIGF